MPVDSHSLGMGHLRVDTKARASRDVEALVDFDTLTPASELAEDYDPFAVRLQAGI